MLRRIKILVKRSIVKLTKDQRMNMLKKIRKRAKKEEIIRNVAVKGVSFGVARGETFALLGVNGAGKSSTFNCMMGKETISGGTVWLNG
mmetsp:Transcript_84295/g.116486  ORF Transcript_84295/g.116486 Transcript_84295/m.116486 type:complete len:89 (+) Transcript_84295:4108-4374(+)